MRILRESVTWDEPELREVDVALEDGEAAPEVGSLVHLRGVTFRVLEVGRWQEAYSSLLDYREDAVMLRVARDDRDEATGVRELGPGGPSPLITGAEAEPPADRWEDGSSGTLSRDRC